MKNIFILLISCLTTLSFGQGLDIVWSKNYGGSDTDVLDKVIIDSNGDFIAIGTTYSNDYDLEGQEFEENNIWVIKGNVNTGELIWDRVIELDGQQNVQDFVITPDNGYAIIGGNYNDPLYEETYYSFFLKLHESGDLLWKRDYLWGGFETLKSLTNTSDNGFVIVGDNKFMKLNSFGNLIWEESLSYFQIGDVIEADDGSYVFLTNHNSIHNLYKYDVDGNQLWHKTYEGGGVYNVFSNKVIQTEDEGFLIVGMGQETEEVGYVKYHIIKLNADAEIEWNKTYGGSSHDMARSAYEDEDGNFLIFGESASSNGDVSNPNGELDVWIIKINSSGDLIWEKSFGGSGRDGSYLFFHGVHFAVTDDGGILVASKSKSADGDLPGNYGDYDYWIFRLENDVEMSTQDLQISEFYVYPNPTKGVVYFNKNVKDIKVYDITGKMVKSFVGNKELIDITNLSNGVYIIKYLDGNNQLHASKIIKQ